MTKMEDHLKELFDNPESGPDETEGKPSLPDKGQVLADNLATEDQIEQEVIAQEEGVDQPVKPPEKEEAKPEAKPEGEVTEEPAPQLTVEERIAAAEKIAAARMRQIDRLRKRDAKNREKIDALEAEFATFKKAITGTEEEDAIVQEQLQQNPALRRIYERVEGMARTQEPVVVDEAAAEIHEYGINSVQTFRQHTPDFDSAYQFLRAKNAKDAGLDRWAPLQRDQQLNVWEHEFTEMCADAGEDPATVIYAMAQQAGWKPGAQPAKTATNGNGAAKATQERSVRRVRDAINTPSLSQTGVNGNPTGDTISREEFYRRYDKAQRIAIFQSARGEDIFERLGTTGEVPVSLLT